MVYAPSPRAWANIAALVPPSVPALVMVVVPVPDERIPKVPPVTMLPAPRVTVLLPAEAMSIALPVAMMSAPPVVVTPIVPEVDVASTPLASLETLPPTEMV